jgi:hypothetical protein
LLIPLAPFSIPLSLPLYTLLLTWHPPAVIGMSPQSQVGDKLTHLDPPPSQPAPSLQIPRTPTAQRLTKTTSGIFRLLLSGTIPMSPSLPISLINIRIVPQSLPLIPRSLLLWWPPGGLSVSSPLRANGSLDSHKGGWTSWEAAQGAQN